MKNQNADNETRGAGKETLGSKQEIELGTAAELEEIRCKETSDIEGGKTTGSPLRITPPHACRFILHFPPCRSLFHNSFLSPRLNSSSFVFSHNGSDFFTLLGRTFNLLSPSFSYTYPCTHTCAYIHIPVHTHTYMCTHTHIPVHTHTYPCTHTHTHTIILQIACCEVLNNQDIFLKEKKNLKEHLTYPNLT